MAEWNEQWDTDEWRSGALAWVDLVLEAYGIERTGDAERQRVRLQATVFAVPTDHGRLYVKAACPGQGGEPSVTATAAHLAPEQLVMPLAIEPHRGWMVSPDYGDTLRAVPGGDYQVWARIARDFARLQVELLPFGDTLFDAGLLQLDPAWLPQHIDGQLMLHASLPPGHPLHLPGREAEELDARLPAVREMCAFLASGPVPLGLDHNDLHRGSAFLPTRPDEPLRFLDLGDAYWAHPFSVLRRPLAELRAELGCGPDDPRLQRVVAAYLGEWAAFGTVEELRPYVEPALRLGRVQGHAVWMRILEGASEDDLRRNAAAPLRALAELPDPVLA